MHLSLLRAILLISYAAAIAAMSIGSYSCHRCIEMFCSVRKCRYDVLCENGSVVIRQLQRYEFVTPLRFGLYLPETKRQFEGFKKEGWWHGDNSWWERTGYTVQSRYRAWGFEVASGTYWPPFVWQHPTVPFNLVQFPIWVLVFLFSLLPAARILRKLRSIWRLDENYLVPSNQSRTTIPK